MSAEVGPCTDALGDSRVGEPLGVGLDEFSRHGRRSRFGHQHGSIGYNDTVRFPRGPPATEPAMTQITIPALVVNGHLQHEKSLTDLEGQHVLATLTVVPKNVQPIDLQKWRHKIESLKT